MPAWARQRRPFAHSSDPMPTGWQRNRHVLARGSSSVFPAPARSATQLSPPFPPAAISRGHGRAPGRRPRSPLTPRANAIPGGHEQQDDDSSWSRRREIRATLPTGTLLLRLSVGCATAEAVLTTLHVSQRIGRKLGQGAFGSVIEAFNDISGERVAVKMLPLAVDDDRHQEKITVRREWCIPCEQWQLNQMLCRSGKSASWPS